MNAQKSLAFPAFVCHDDGMLRNSSYPGHQRALALNTTSTYLRVADCKACGHAIAWAQSKAGKWYPCQVRVKLSEEYGIDNDVLRAAPWEPHGKHCGIADPR